MTVETGLAEFDGYADGSGKRELEVADILGNLNTIPGSLCYHSAEVKEEVYAVAEVEAVEDTTTVDPFSICNRSDCKTAGYVRSNIPNAGLFVTPEGVSEAPEEVTGDEVLLRTEGSAVFAKNVVGKTKPVDTAADEGGPPLTEGYVYCQTADALCEGNTGSVLEVQTCVPTSAKANPSVVKSLVGLISTTNDFTVFVTVCILLSESVHGEEEACCCKSSKNHFDTFHNFVLTLINFAVLKLTYKGLSVQI